MSLERSLLTWYVLTLALCRGLSCAAQSPDFLLPSGVVYDAAGNLFVADVRRNQVFEVALSGVTTVVAGTGAQGFAGDGGAATLALLDKPSSVAVATDGTIYIADTGNQRIRAVAGGQIQTVAGNGLKGFAGDGGSAQAAKFNMPVALAVDNGGGLLIADSANHRLRRLFAGVLTTVAGNGVQGFAGDGAAATLAQLDTPSGVAVASDGRIFIADSHNHRIRVVGADGRITTFAGNGVRGFGGDGGAATSASLFLPRGVAMFAAGGVIFADSDNQRLRLVDAQGIITTVAGNGVQGSSADGSVATASPLDSPRGVALSSFSAPVFADAHNRVVREVALDKNLYVVPGGASRVAIVTLTGPTKLTYGQGTLGASVSAVPEAQGSVALLDGGTPVSVGVLANATVTLPTDLLSAGQHALIANFLGDGSHPAARSAAMSVSVAPLSVLAIAQPATLTYGSFLPEFTGTVTGVLPRDTAKVATKFTANVPDLAPVGVYPITASLSGAASGNYVVTLAPSSGSLEIVQASAMVTLSVPQTSYAGLPVTLSATVAPATRGVPAGLVNFADNGTVVGTGTVVGGVAAAVYLSPGAGAHTITAAYGGDHNFLAGTSPVTAFTVSAMPDFLLAVSGSASQSVQGGGVASYALQIAAQPGPFSGAVVLGATGLPPGATVSFSPQTVVPGSGSAPVTMSIQTIALATRESGNDAGYAGLLALGIAVPWMLVRKRRGVINVSLVGFVAVCLFWAVGCGDRSFGVAAHVSQTFPITVTATSTNLAGVVVTHSASVTLIVQ